MRSSVLADYSSPGKAQEATDKEGENFHAFLFFFFFRVPALTSWQFSSLVLLLRLSLFLLTFLYRDSVWREIGPRFLMEIRQSFISELDKVPPFFPPGWQLSPRVSSGSSFHTESLRWCMCHRCGSDSDSLGSHLSLSPLTVPLEMSAGAERSCVESLTLTSWRLLPLGPAYAEPLLFLCFVSSQARRRARCTYRGYFHETCVLCH